LYSSTSIIRIFKLRRRRCAGHVVWTEEKRNVYWLLVGKPEGKRPLARPRCRLVANMDLFGLLCNSDDGRDMFLRNVSQLSQDYMALHPTKTELATCPAVKTSNPT
jgi:hypothetical protein